MLCRLWGEPIAVETSFNLEALNELAALSSLYDMHRLYRTLSSERDNALRSP